MVRHTRCSCTTWVDKNTSLCALQQISWMHTVFSGCTSLCHTLGESEDPVSTISTEQPGNSSTLEGVRLKTGFFLERSTDLWPTISFFLGVEIGGRMVWPDMFPPLCIFVEGEKPSINQYNSRVLRPRLVSLKWYWHDPGLKWHSRGSRKVRHCKYETIDLQFYLLVPEVRAEVDAGSKRPVGDNCCSSACGRQTDGVCLTILDGHFQCILKLKCVLKVSHNTELQLASWWHFPLTGFNMPQGLRSALMKQDIQNL